MDLQMLLQVEMPVRPYLKLI